MLPLLLVVALLLAPTPCEASPLPRTFGAGIIEYARNSTFPALVVLDHQLRNDSAYGVLGHIWDTGEIVNYDLVLDIFIDGDETPSLSFQPGLASGQGYAKEFGDFGGDGQEPPYEVFAAGDKMGKSAQIGGWYSYHKVLFQDRIKVTARTLGGQQAVYLSVRGWEVQKSSSSADGLTLSSGQFLPRRARLQIHHIDNVTYRDQDVVPLLQLPQGCEGLLYLVTLAASAASTAAPIALGAIEAFADGNKSRSPTRLANSVPELFGNDPEFARPRRFANSTVGLLHYSKMFSNGTIARPSDCHGPGEVCLQRLSGYHFFMDDEDSKATSVRFLDGGWLQWRRGGDVAQGTAHQQQSGDTTLVGSDVQVRSYAWVYVWSTDPSSPPPPNPAPLLCKDPKVCGPPFPPASLEVSKPPATAVPAVLAHRQSYEAYQQDVDVILE